MHLSKICSSGLRKSLCLVLFSLAANFALANIVRVPADQPTIQAGIDAASSGDTVLVAPGTYYENIDFKGKAITVTSSGGAAQTIIDGGAKTSTVIFKTAELRNSVLSGFTVRNGGPNTNPTDFGSGIEIVATAPTIINNIISGNACHGIEVSGGAPLLQANTISGTSALPSYCNFNGSGILLIGNPEYPLNVLDTVITGNIIEQNLHAISYDGGGIMIWANEGPVIENNIIRNNATTGQGGAIASYNSIAVTIVQNLITGNTATNVGAALSLHPPDSSLGPFIGIIANNTITGNTFSGPSTSTDQAAGQVYLEGNLGQYVVVNNIVASQNSLPAMVCGTIYNYLSITPLVFDHNDIYNSRGQAYGGACPDQTGAYGNISADPRFSNAAAGDYHLLQGSPAIDSGNNSAPQLPAKDLDGNPRLQDATGVGYPIVDMGVYEFAGPQDANPTILTLTPSTYETYGGNTITLTAKLTSANGIPTGSVLFFEDGNQLGATVIDNTGTATYAPTGLVPGVHAFLATYSGVGSFTPAVSVKFYVLIDKYIRTLKLTSSPNPSLVSQPVTFTVTVTSADNIILSPITLTDGSTTLATLTPNSSGIATYTTSSLSLGTHNIQATYAGDATHSGANASLIQTVANGYPTPSTLTSSLNPATVGQSVTFTDTVTFNGSAWTSAPGTITFYDNGATLGSQPITAQPNSTTTAAFTTSAVAAGSHTISAILTSGNDYSSSATLSQVIVGLPTTTTLTASPLNSYALQPITLTAAVSTTTTSTLTGSVTFYDGTIALGTASLDNTGHVSFPIPLPTSGTHLFHAVYSGDATFATSTSLNVSDNIQINPTITTLNVSTTPVVAFQFFTLTVQTSSQTAVPYSAQNCVGCTITVKISGLPPNIPSTTTSGIPPSGIFSPKYAFGTGTYTFTVTFNGNLSFAPSTATIRQTVVIAPTSLGLSASPTTANQHQPVNLTANLTAPNSIEAPHGTISFFDGSTPIGTAFVAAGGLTNTNSATINTTSLAPGTHTITASYPGDIDFIPATSAPVTVTITPLDYTLTTPIPAIPIKTEHHLTVKVNLASIGGFADSVALGCTNLPAHASCTFDQNSLQLLPNGTATTNVTIDTDDVLGYARNESHGAVSSISYALLLFPTGLLALISVRQHGRLLRLLLALIAIGGLALTLNGCSGLYPKSTTPGTYTINLNGVGANTGLAHTQPITLTVTP